MMSIAGSILLGICLEGVEANYESSRAKGGLQRVRCEVKEVQWLRQFFFLDETNSSNRIRNQVHESIDRRRRIRALKSIASISPTTGIPSPKLTSTISTNDFTSDVPEEDGIIVPRTLSNDVKIAYQIAMEREEMRCRSEKRSRRTNTVKNVPKSTRSVTLLSDVIRESYGLNLQSNLSQRRGLPH